MLPSTGRRCRSAVKFTGKHFLALSERPSGLLTLHVSALTDEDACARYRRERLQPAARAWASLQNHRSPYSGEIRVTS